MALASTSVYVVEGAPQNGRQCLCPQGELQLPPASLGDSPRSAGRSDPSSFQITASALGPVVCVALCAPFKTPESQPCWPSKPNILGTHLPGAGPPGWGTQCGTQTPHSLGKIGRAHV